MPYGSNPVETIKLIEQIRIQAFKDRSISELDNYYFNQNVVGRGSGVSQITQLIQNPTAPVVINITAVKNVHISAANDRMTAEVDYSFADGSTESANNTFIATNRGDTNGYRWYLVDQS